MLFAGTLHAQRPNCWEYYRDDPENIDQVYFPHEKNCQFFYQCTSHGAVRMKCNPGMYFDRGKLKHFLWLQLKFKKFILTN